MTGFDLETDRPGIWRRLLARVYGRLIGLRLWLYRTGVLKRFRLPARVVSVGNLTVGGTGKTPAAIFIARSLQARGFKVAVLSRGYKAARRGQVNVVSDGREVLLGPSQAGDEACLMARALPGVPVLSGRNRAALGRYAVERFGTGVLVLDDGFQHLPLERDVDLLLLDARQPWGNGRLLPAGPLREPEAEAARATAFLITRTETPPEELIEGIRRDFPDRPVFTARHRPVRLVRLDGEEERDAGWLAGRRIMAFCGLGRPLSFLDTLVGLGAEVPLFMRWPDHHMPSKRDLMLLEVRAYEWRLDVAVTTAKDAIKIGGREVGGRVVQPLDVWVLEVELELTDGEEAFMDMLAAAGGEG